LAPTTGEVEAEIDNCVQAMAVWNVRRDVLLRRLMDIWRDGLELVQLMVAHRSCLIAAHVDLRPIGWPVFAKTLSRPYSAPVL